MSIKVITYVWENSKAKGSALLLLLAIADHAHDDGDGAYPSVETLAAKCRHTERNTQRLLRHLEATGEIIIKDRAGPHGCNVYVIPLCGGDKMSGVTSGAQGVQSTVQGVTSRVEKVPQMSPEPSLTVKESSRAVVVEPHETAAAPNIFKLYENLGLFLNPTIADMLKEAEQEYPAEWITEAFKRAASANIRKWGYVQAILKAWSANGGIDDPKPKLAAKGQVSGVPPGEVEDTYKEFVKIRGEWQPPSKDWVLLHRFEFETYENARARHIRDFTENVLPNYILAKGEP